MCKGVIAWRRRWTSSRLAEHGREPLFGLGSHEFQGLPGAFEALLVEETQSAVTDAHGAWREAIVIFSMQDVVLKLLFGDEIGDVP